MVGVANSDLMERAQAIRLLLTDVDGVLTDTGVYVSDQGEAFKRFSVRDGMGVERLRKLAGVEVGIITGELSGSVRQRAAKLNIRELHLGIKDKLAVLHDMMERHTLAPHEIAYIGDDTNDLEIMAAVGLTACPVDAVSFVLDVADYICPNRGGYGAFRDFAELIIAANQSDGTGREDHG